MSNSQRSYVYAPPLRTKPGRLTAWRVGSDVKAGFSKPPSALADQLHDAVFGTAAQKLAEAEWHKAHRRESE